MPVLGGTGSGGETDGDVALFGERLQQTYDVAGERSASSKRWRACRNLHRLIVINAIGYGVIPAAARDGRSCDHQFSAATAAANGELHRGAIRAAARRRGGGEDRRIVHRRGGLADNPVVASWHWASRRRDVTRQLFQTFQPLCMLHQRASAKMCHRIARALCESDSA